ncbi:MFS transporter [Zooshikella marina]|uniref:MFS transporter n=1 Tax=Zooshikella ganghwensis TaxID=202772 RepID=UPI001BB035C5|nr:MFS transporter [Zooshikella ganghwensis]MBU2708897.1 MFS transporter [Zooshikella ganghwensis]
MDSSSLDVTFEKTKKTNHENISVFYFGVILVATMVSVLGTMITDFALGQWVYKTTNSTTAYSLIGFAALAPQLLLAPFVGTIIDRYPRNLLMILGHAGAGCCTLLLLVLYATDSLQVWQIIILACFSSVFNGLVSQTFIVLIPVLVKKEHFGRAQGFIQGSTGIIQIAAPAIAAFALAVIDLKGIFIVDICSFSVVIIVLLSINSLLKKGDGREVKKDEQVTKNSWKSDIRDGLAYLKTQPSLLKLLLFFSIVNFSMGMVEILFPPLILSFYDVVELGTILSVSGLGTLAGGILLSIWGGPKKRIQGMYLFLAIMGSAIMLIGGAFVFEQYTILILSAIGFIVTLCFVTVDSCDQIVWQTVVPTGFQGRVFGIQTLLAQLAIPVSFLIAGPLADHVFEPMMSADGLLAETVGSVIGVGPGKGILLLYSICGLLVLLNIAVFKWLSDLDGLDKIVNKATQ